VRQALQRVQKATRQDLEAARKALRSAGAELGGVRGSAHPAPDQAPCFCPDVNRRLMAPVPPRMIAVRAAANQPCASLPDCPAEYSSCQKQN
jgi:hypothetical protein